MQHGPQDTPPQQQSPAAARGLIVVNAYTCRPPGADAAADLCDRASASLAAAGHAGPADLAFLFFTPHHAPDLASIERTIATRLSPGHLIGCSAETVLAGAFELEGTPAISLLALVMPGVFAKTFSSADLPASLAQSELEDSPAHTDDLAAVASAAGIGPGHRATVLLADPFTTPIDAVLGALNTARALANPHGAGGGGSDGDHRRAPIVGGFASAAARPGGNTLLVDGRITTSGCVGVSLAGALQAECIVSQGCRPVGPNLIVTRSQGQFIRSLGGRPALKVLEEIIESLNEPQRALLGGGLLVGRVVNEYKDHFGRADYLMRAVVGVMKQDNAIAVADRVRTGQTVRFHIRDAATAHEDLSMLLDAQALHGPPAGALVFTCNGRGTRLFSSPHHDSQAIQQAFQQDEPAEMKAK
ncbi:MAG: FIST N-terminal domain-containing protein, partial [Phycisphaerales bacterium]|nr:FIST N-terminal domain-containing protein [Phycisphaerales bacterium]